MAEEQPETITGQPCPMCQKKKLTLMEAARDVPYFGIMYMFSMTCTECGYHKADVEAEGSKGKVKYTFEVESEEDLKVRVVKASTATVKIPRIMTIEPGAASNGYVTNIEGLLNRVKVMLEKTRDNSDDKAARKKAKNMLKKVQDAMWGRGSMTVILEDPNGNSAIISEKAKKGK
jgi:zinc finger protein